MLQQLEARQSLCAYLQMQARADYGLENLTYNVKRAV